MGVGPRRSTEKPKNRRSKPYTVTQVIASSPSPASRTAENSSSNSIPRGLVLASDNESDTDSVRVLSEDEVEPTPSRARAGPSTRKGKERARG